MVLYIQKYDMQTMNIMKQEKRASLPGGARRFGFVCSFSFEMFWEERMAKYVMALDAGTTSNRCILFDEKGKMCSVAQPLPSSGGRSHRRRLKWRPIRCQWPERHICFHPV